MVTGDRSTATAASCAGALPTPLKIAISMIHAAQGEAGLGLRRRIRLMRGIFVVPLSPDRGVLCFKNAGASVYPKPEQRRHEPAANNRALDQKRVLLGYSQPEND